MKILHYTRRAFSLVGYLSNERTFASQTIHAIVSFLFILTLLVFEVSSIIYVVIHLKAGDYRNSLYASLQVMAVLPTIPSFFTMMYHKDKVRDVIGYFQKMSDQCTGY